MSRLIQGLEHSGCRTRRMDRCRLEVRVPGWGASYLPWDEADRLVVTVDERGRASWSLDYFSPVQCALHLGVSAVFALEACTAASPDPWRFFGAWVLSQLAVVLVVLGSLIRVRARFSREVFRGTG